MGRGSVDFSLGLLTDNVSLAGGDGVLEFIRNHAEFILRCPVDRDGVVRRRAKLLADGGSVRSCDKTTDFRKILMSGHTSHVRLHGTASINGSHYSHGTRKAGNVRSC